MTSNEERDWVYLFNPVTVTPAPKKIKQKLILRKQHEKISRTEAKRNLETHYDLSVETKDIKITNQRSLRHLNLDRMHDWHFRKTTPDVYQKAVRKNRSETRTCHSVWCSKSWSLNHVILSYSKHWYVVHHLLERCCSFLKPIFKNFRLFRTRKKNKYLPNVSKETAFDRLHQMTRLSYDVKKCR